MEEKVLIKSKAYYTKKTANIFMVILLLACVISSAVWSYNHADLEMKKWFLERIEPRYEEHKGSDKCLGETCQICNQYEMDIQGRRDEIMYWPIWTYEECIKTCSGLPFVATVVFVFCLLMTWWLKNHELMVTDKRVYGKVAFGRRVNVPLDSISAVSTVGFVKDISLYTSSGSINFRMIKNADEVCGVINGLLLERQESKKKTTNKETDAAPNNAAELKQYKELLDEGIISQEEFDAKKKQLLGL